MISLSIESLQGHYFAAGILSGNVLFHLFCNCCIATRTQRLAHRSGIGVAAGRWPTSPRWIADGFARRHSFMGTSFDSQVGGCIFYVVVATTKTQ
jgi:hypothetical protein